MKITLKKEEIDQIKKYILKIQKIYDYDEANEIQKDLLFLILNPEYEIFKNDKKNEAEEWWYSSGIYQEVKKRKNKAKRNEKYRRENK